MEIKEFLYEQDFSDIKKVFLYYNIAHKSTTLTSMRIGKYTEIDLKFDCKKNLLLKFPSFEDKDFENYWNLELSKFRDNNIDIYEEMDCYAAELIFKLNGDKIMEFIINKIKKLIPQQKDMVLNFVNNSPENTKEYNCEYTGVEGDLFISIGLLYQGSYYNSDGTLRNSNYYYFPKYMSGRKNQIIKYIQDIAKSKKTKQKRTKKVPVNLEDSGREIFKLTIIKKGKKGRKKIKFGIAKLEIGAELNGQEQSSISFKCGNCGSLDRFTIYNPEKNLLKCENCQALNQPIGKDLYYFDN